MNCSVAEHIGLISDAMAGTDKSVQEAFEIVKYVKMSKSSRLWILGNGGSLAIAQHFAQDLVKCCGVRAHAITDPSMITAYSNDHSFDYSYFGPLLNLMQKGDPIFIFSCSGKSRNYIEFISMRVKPIVSVVGTSGGFLLTGSDVCVHVKSNDYRVCETAFCVVADLIVGALMEESE